MLKGIRVGPDNTVEMRCSDGEWIVIRPPTGTSPTTMVRNVRKWFPVEIRRALLRANRESPND